MIIYVLSNGWHQLDEKDLETWVKDGSLKEGDLIIYPAKKFIVEERIVPTLTAVLVESEID